MVPSTARQDSQECQLQMDNIHTSLNESIIIKAFRIMGFSPTLVKIIKCKDINNPKYFGSVGYVAFESEKEALRALHACNNERIHGTNIIFKLSHISGFEPTLTLWVGNLPKDISDEKFSKLFSDKYATMYSAKVTFDSNGKSIFGILRFGSESEYKLCLKEMNGYNLMNNFIKVSQYNDFEPVGSNPKSLKEQQEYWKAYSNIPNDYFNQASNILQHSHSIEIPRLSRLYLRNELELVDHNTKYDFKKLNLAKSHQDYILWDPLEASKWSVPEFSYYDCLKIPESF